MIHNSKKKGLIITYIGNGKGKTTAAVGLAVRAAGAGKKVLFTQFVKSGKAKAPGEWPPSSEISILEKTKGVTVKVLGKGFVGILGDRKKHIEHIKAAKKGLVYIKNQIQSKRYDIVIADELISAIEVKLLSTKEVKMVISLAHKYLSALVLTGHNKYNDLIVASDLVTEMKMIKHPYYKGIIAQRGIDF
ncbi:MAG: cob(I)yrinic acid a,c-diamide adenosyltransferase [Candidatus Doudnabacteria bacterium CG10_big_fil_rev_8_21_14_0_10_41_10]|uniref:Cob(I)yrinic acid a,c-diamide adenosyltransferase n=1 Tax=Candidatus Doudnabacteria bacterium CG10_big_fil_rev_8_21_14_0_10_41_10 TaxID=1974551 RepID=A0A2H0VCG5_9BACT|nr:MAG: cob(I)yrinic acid a,c-diamide adenosyltransferase [Candidatus Doudnabacteria bacterium CG10_big_fil_rev_8_21_14_0_10_41_10]